MFHQRGLRQGDPLSPMLFILVMDVLNCLIEKASNEGLLQPLAARNIHHRVSLYTDDVVLFLRPVATDLQMAEDLLQPAALWFSYWPQDKYTEKQCLAHSLLRGRYDNSASSFTL